jgi:flagellar FliJ protein
MPKFVFPLEGVLKQRRYLEQEAQRDLAMCRQELQLAQQELRALELEVHQSKQDMRKNRLLGSINLHFLAAHRRYVISRERKALEIATKIASATKRVEQAQRLLVEASKQRKVIEKLRERAFERFKVGIEKREANALDELTVQQAYEQLNAKSVERP